MTETTPAPVTVSPSCCAFCIGTEKVIHADGLDYPCPACSPMWPDPAPDQILNNAKPLPQPEFCLFDSEVRPGTLKLDDAFILEMILIYDYTDHGAAALARMFGLDIMDFYYFTHRFKGKPSAASNWIDTVGIVEGDEGILNRAGSPACVKADLCVEYDVTYPNHTYNLIATLAAAMDRRSVVGIPGVETLEELKESWEFYRDGTEAVSDLLKRAVAPEGN